MSTTLLTVTAAAPGPGTRCRHLSWRLQAAAGIIMVLKRCSELVRGTTKWMHINVTNMFLNEKCHLKTINYTLSSLISYFFWWTQEGPTVSAGTRMYHVTKGDTRWGPNKVNFTDHDNYMLRSAGSRMLTVTLITGTQVRHLINSEEVKFGKIQTSF